MRTRNRGIGRRAPSPAELEWAVDTAERRSRILYTNARGCWLIVDGLGSICEIGPSWFHFEPDTDVIGRACLDLIHRADRRIANRAFAKALETERGYAECELRVVNSLGVELVVEAHFSNYMNEPLIGGVVVNVQDVTDARKAEIERRVAEERFRLGFEHGAVAMGMCDYQHRLLRVNTALATLLGREQDELLGRSMTEFVHPEDRAGIILDHTMLRDGSSPSYRSERRLLRPDGSVRYVSVDAVAVANEPGVDPYVFAQIQDNTEQREREALLSYQSLHDALTGLANRSLLRDRVERALDRAEARDAMVGLAFVGIDRFTVVNDSLGHSAGDRLLIELAERLSASAGRGDTVARFAGDVFTVVREVTDESDLVAMSERVAVQLAPPFFVGGEELHLSASCGLVLVRPGTSADDALRDGASAMHRAKWRGGGRSEVFNVELRSEVERRFSLEQALAFALERGELRVVYQPIVNLLDGMVVGAEALLRWDHPEQGTVGPAEFIEAAEATGLIVPIGEFVLGEALRQVVEWRASLPGAESMWISVNLSTRQLLFGDIARTCAEAMAAAGAAPDALHLELTESTVMEEVDASINLLNRINDLGVGIAIDDFGTGHSSLSYLDRLPVSTLKIDRSFVASLVEHAESSPVLDAIVSLATSMHLELCAEGVELEHQMDALVDLGCGLAQGYFFARPLSPEDFVAFVNKSVPGRLGLVAP